MEAPSADDGAGIRHGDQRVLPAAGGLLTIAANIGPDILPPAFFPVGLNLAGRVCLVIGAAGDREAAEKETALRTAGAAVRRLTDWSDLRDADVADAYFVIFTPQEQAPAARLRELADRHKFLLCAIDQPAYGSVAMSAVVSCGRARIAISTGGAAPAIGGKLKAALQAALDETFAGFLECLASQRRRGYAKLTASEERRTAMKGAAEGFALEIRVTYPRWFRDHLRLLGPNPLDNDKTSRGE